MSTALQTVKSNSIETKDLLSGQDLDVLRNSKFKGFTDAEISYAARVCSHLQLNPMLNQIHFVKRNGRDGATITTQVGIDGFRLAAQRAGGYAGQDDAFFEGTDSKPVKASVTVYRIVNGIRCAFTASARWSEYAVTGNAGQMWAKMPHTMLAKCAEALALRKAFPAELSGVRSDEEMLQSEDAPASKAASLNQRAPLKDITEDAIEAESTKVPDLNVPPCFEPKISLEQMSNRKFPFWDGYKGKSYYEIGDKRLVQLLNHIEKLPNPSKEVTDEAAHIIAYLNALDAT